MSRVCRVELELIGIEKWVDSLDEVFGLLHYDLDVDLLDSVKLCPNFIRPGKNDCLADLRVVDDHGEGGDYDITAGLLVDASRCVS